MHNVRFPPFSGTNNLYKAALLVVSHTPEEGGPARLAAQPLQHPHCVQGTPTTHYLGTGPSIKEAVSRDF